MYRKYVSRSSSEFDADLWAQMAVMCMCTPAQALIKQQIAIAPLRVKPCATAFVARPDQKENAVMVLVLLKAMRSVRPCEVFATQNEAVAWLKQKMAEVSSV